MLFLSSAVLEYPSRGIWLSARSKGECAKGLENGKQKMEVDRGQKTVMMLEMTVLAMSSSVHLLFHTVIVYS